VAGKVRLLVLWLALASFQGLLKCSIFKPAFESPESVSHPIVLEFNTSYPRHSSSLQLHFL
jgi:hypothetical protein